MRRLDNFGKINMTQTGILSSGDSDIATSLKVFKFPGYGSVMGISSHSYSGVNGDKYLRGIVSSDTVNNYLKWLIGIMSQNVFGKISDICYLPTNSIITLENNSLYITKWQGNFTNFVYEPFLTKPGITIKSINVISPTSILLSGSNNGYCWYGFINYAGTTTVEHTIYERPGTFCTSNVNPDKSILFSGLLNKNHNENYLYLYLTKPIIMGREDTITQKELVIFPNPANDELCVKTTFDFSIPKKIKIYDYYGDNVLTKEVNQTGQDYIRIDLSGLNMGVYYIQLEYDTKVAYQKFIIIR